MARLRPIAIAIVLALLTGLPAYACAATQHASAAEMECCRHMDGGCDMGAGQDSCCNTTMQSTYDQSFAPAHVEQVAAPLMTCGALHAFSPASSFERRQISPAALSPSPPGQAATLRI